MNRGIAHLVAGTVLSFVIFILPPVSVHAPNAAEFTEPALLLLLPFIGLFLVGALLAGLISRLTSYPPALLVIYLCCSAASLIVTQIFSSSAGIVIDGGFHEYELSYLRASGEILAVVATFGLGFLFRRRIGENGGFIAAAISLWALASAGMAAAHYLPAAQSGEAPDEELEPSDAMATLAELSSELNILHIMFDSFQSDAFSEIIENSPSIRAELDGFVLYAEHSGYSNWTSLSLPAILTGHLYFEEHADDQETAYDLIRRWMAEDSIMSRLQKRGFSVGALQPGRFFCEGVTYPCTTIQANAAELEQLGEQASADAAAR